MDPIRSPSRGLGAACVACLFVLLAAATMPASQPVESTATEMVQALGGSAILDLPGYQPPVAFSEDLVIHSRGQTIAMTRSTDHGQTRTEMAVEGKHIVMIEMGDDKGTSYTLLTDEKRAFKQSRQATEALPAGKGQKTSAAQATSDAPELTPADYTVEDLGDDTVSGVAARKMRITMNDGIVVGWFDKMTGGPLRLAGTVQGQHAEMEWKNRKVAPQPAKQFQVPKSYQITDLDEVMANMGSMSGIMQSMGGVDPSLTGRAAGMMGSMGQNFAESFGGRLGGALGGPLGAIAGRYLGRKIGGMLGAKAGFR